MKVERQRAVQHRKALAELGKEEFFDAAITVAEDNRMATAKLTNTVTVDGHGLPSPRKRVGAI